MEKASLAHLVAHLRASVGDDARNSLSETFETMPVFHDRTVNVDSYAPMAASVNSKRFIYEWPHLNVGTGVEFICGG